MISIVEKSVKKLYRMVFSKYNKGGFWLTLCGLTIYGYADADMRIPTRGYVVVGSQRHEMKRFVDF